MMDILEVVGNFRWSIEKWYIPVHFIVYRQFQISQIVFFAAHNVRVALKSKYLFVLWCKLYNGWPCICGCQGSFIMETVVFWHCYSGSMINKANLRDLIASTGLVISNWIQIVNFSARVTVKFDRWPRKALLLYYVKLCASFQIHWWIQTGFTVQKRSIRVEIGDMLSRVTLKFDGWPWKTIGHLFYATSSFV